MTFSSWKGFDVDAVSIPGALSGDNCPFRHIRMIVIEEFVCSGFERTRKHRDLAPTHNDLFKMQIAAFEFGRGRIAVFNLNAKSLVGRHAQFNWIELMILEGEREYIHGGCYGRRTE